MLVANDRDFTMKFMHHQARLHVVEPPKTSLHDVLT
jgi:hypothetical protein